MNKYYEEIEHIIKKNEVNKRVRQIEDNYDTLKNYFNIGRLIVEAQGGEKHAKYGNELIKDWSKKLSINYSKGYDESNLRRFRQFYLSFQKCGTLSHKLTWSHYYKLLPIKDENKRNYYINLCLEHNLSVRELTKEIKSNSYERLIDKPDKIEIELPKQNVKVTSNIKNPIIIYVEDENVVKNHKDLELEILSQLQAIFRQLGKGYALIGNEYKITHDGIDNYIDVLLFNYKENRFVVVELKTRELRREDKSQIKFYMELVDEYVKEPFHNMTFGILITKEQDEYVATFVSEEDIIPITYEIRKGKNKNSSLSK